MSETTRSAAHVADDSETSLRITRRIRAMPEELLDAWTDPESVRVWMCPGGVRQRATRPNTGHSVADAASVRKR
jgi:uncharacterized protein YndB with AHSA1/START domain